ncbi:hypothetical protein BI347_16110 [Chromobacterium sphagni]|uniref:Uncharacterized protein n=1 Tax=Chromobacterium sphagni TaxID=1903179 RepID=A0A1S1WVC1_9NEIS|nr:hypothetical protein [Chromobacterium sphagni]OHX11224.1 hypothetical protein BI347_16110 [Chromobacterium sphagni]
MNKPNQSNAAPGAPKQATPDQKPAVETPKTGCETPTPNQGQPHKPGTPAYDPAKDPAKTPAAHETSAHESSTGYKPPRY